MWHMVCIYTGSRYFAKYYPAERWTKRMDNVRRGYRAWIESPKSGCRDSLFWFNTGIEPAFEFYMLDGFDDLDTEKKVHTLANMAVETVRAIDVFRWVRVSIKRAAEEMKQ